MLDRLTSIMMLSEENVTSLLLLVNTMIDKSKHTHIIGLNVDCIV